MTYLARMLERLMPDDLFAGGGDALMDVTAWLRERAETTATSGQPEANARAAALFEAADAWEAEVSGATAASADAAPR